MRIQWGKGSAAQLGKKLAATAVAGLLVMQPLFTTSTTLAAAVAVKEPTVTMMSEEPITAGATLRKYVWKSTRNNEAVSVKGNVIAIDLNNPYVQLDVITGVDNQLTKKETVVKMAAQAGAVAAVNGDYYNVQAEGAPIGPQIANNELMSSPSFITGMYTFALTKDKKPLMDSFTFTGNITTTNGMQYPLLGINKTYYYMEPNSVHSHGHAMYIYTHAWGSTARANDGATTPTEVLVKNGVIQQISDNTPLNMIPPVDGYILRAAGKAAEFVRANMQVGQQLSSEYELISVNSAKKYDVNEFRMMIGGHTIMVDEGKPTAYSRSVSSIGGNRARTGIGYSKDNRYVYLITVDSNGESKGMSIKEFQEFMISVGVWKGMNLDGGGSTQMVSRPLGDFDVKLANAPEYDSQRKVVNGLGVYSIAPQGAVKGLTVQGQPVLFINEQATFNMKAYDVYYNPVKLDSLSTVRWTSSSPIGSFAQNTFTASKQGTTTLTAKAGTAQHSMDVEVVGRGQIAEMMIQADDAILSEHASYKLPVTLTTKKGQKRTVPANLINWEFIGFKGKMVGDQLTVQQLSDSGVGHMIARYDQFSTMLTLTGGVDKKWLDFDKLSAPIHFEAHPAGTTGTASITAGLPGVSPAGNHALYMTYDFTEGTGTKAAYAVLNGTKGLQIEGKPKLMKLNAMGDNSLNWLRAEMVDAKGQKHLVDLHDHINWTGWKSLNVDLTKYKMSYPITLKRIYVANPEQGQDEREAIGVIVIDDISFQYEGGQLAYEKKLVKLAVGRESITVNDEVMKLDQAPVVIKGHTLIPIRFFVDAMGGQLAWDNKQKKVTIMRGDHLIELWMDQAELVVDGRAVIAPITPRVLNGRTVLPLRLISEKLGWKVSWDQKTKSIVLE